MNNSEFETSAKNVRFKSDSFSGGSLTAGALAPIREKRRKTVTPVPLSRKTVNFGNFYKPVITLGHKRKIFSRTIPAAAGDLNLSVNRRDSMPDNDKPEKTALYNRKIEASSSEADRLYPENCVHWWHIDSSDRRRPRVKVNCTIILYNLNQTKSVNQTAKELNKRIPLRIWTLYRQRQGERC